MKGRTDVVRTDVHDVIFIKPNFLTSMGYHIFLTMVLRVPLARAELRYQESVVAVAVDEAHCITRW